MKTTKTIFPLAARYARRTVLYVLLGLTGFGGLAFFRLSPFFDF